MIKYGEVNPLNVHGLRRLEHCPPHFTKVEFSIRTSEKDITDWIFENLEGRFWFGEQYFRTDGGSISYNKCAAFEEPAEASYFLLMLDTINKGANWEVFN